MAPKIQTTCLTKTSLAFSQLLHTNLGPGLSSYDKIYLRIIGKTMLRHSYDYCNKSYNITNEELTTDLRLILRQS